MATSSPSPNSSPSAKSPASAPPPPTTNATSPPFQSPPPTTNATLPPFQSPPNTNATSPQSPPSPPPPASFSPPADTKTTSPKSPPPSLSPPNASPPPPTSFAPPTTFSPPPTSQLSADPPLASPPPPSDPSPPPPSDSSPPPPSASPPPTPPKSPPSPSSSPPPLSSSSPPPPPPSPSPSPPPPAKEQPASPPPKNPTPSPPPSSSSSSPPPPKNSPTPPSSSVPPESPLSPPPPTPITPVKSPPPSPGALETSPPPPLSQPPPPSTTFFPPPPSRVQPSPPSPSSTTNSTSGSTPEISSPSGNGGVGTGGVVAIVVVLGLVLLSVVGVVFCFVRRRKRKRSRSNIGYILPTSRTSSPQSDSGLLKAETSASRFVSTSESELVNSPSKRGILGNSRALFTYEELVQATHGFSEQNLLGEGGFGSVYKGCLPDGTEVAVKQLKIGGGQGDREFKAEVDIISRIHHRHLVSLAGYCIWESRRLLVYEYVPNNNLHFHLHEEGRPVMEWDMRVKIAAGAARGIAYLHEDCHPRVIHRDIKSSNILLDKNFEARVSDFGLAKLALDANTHISTRVVGTFGYMAPEYASSGKLTEKSDVFSFGVVLLELITGRKPVDPSQPLGDESLVEWARPLLNQALESEEFEGLADAKLDKNYVGSEMLQMVEVAAACVRHSAVKRPRMGQVVRAFESMVVSDITNGVPVGDSEIYNTAPQSSEIRWFRRMAFGNQDYTTGFFNQGSNLNRSRSFADEV